jgi:hypothetical protein
MQQGNQDFQKKQTEIPVSVDIRPIYADSLWGFSRGNPEVEIRCFFRSA